MKSLGPCDTEKKRKMVMGGLSLPMELWTYP